MDSATLNTISLCSGVGMLDEGVHAGLEFLGIRSRTQLYAEREAFPVSVLAARMEEGSLAPAPIWFGDFTELPARRFRGLVDGVVAGFPCQDLSVAGRRAGLDGKRSGLFFNVLDIADDSGAWFLVLENVAGIASATAAVVDEASTSDYAAKSAGGGFSDVGIEDGRLLERAAARVMGELADRGWNAEWITLSASDVGASHGRARWFCFAWRMADAGLQHGKLQQRRARAEHSGGCIALDDAKSIGWIEGRAEPARQQGRSDAAEHGGAVANAERTRRAQTGSGCEINSGRELEQGRVELADTDCAGLRTIGQRESRAFDAESIGGASVADASGAGFPQRAGGGKDHGTLQQASGAESTGVYRALGIFAPGPADSRWPGLLARFPWLAPAIADEAAESLLRGVVDGLAGGLDFSYRAARLRAGGNGVVPSQAASALVVLIRRSGIF